MAATGTPRIPRDLAGELGRTGLLAMSGYVYEEALPELQQWRGQKVYREMADGDPIIGGILLAVELLARQVEWTVEPAGPHQDQLDDAKFVDECLGDMSSTWQDTLAEILTMLIFGWSYMETVYKYRDGADDDPGKHSKYTDGRIGWARWGVRSQESLLRWDFDPDTGKLLGLWQLPAPDFRLRFIPLEKALHFKTTSRKDNPEGFSFLRRAYSSWYYKNNLQRIEAIGVERDLAGLPVARIPSEVMNNSALAGTFSQYKQLVTNLRNDEQAGVVLPSDTDDKGNRMYDLELLSSGGERSIDTDGVIARYDQRISTAMLADFMLLGQERVGSFALSHDKTAMFNQAIVAVLDNICSVINRFGIPRLLKINGRSVKSGSPELRHGDVTTPDLQMLGGYLAALTSAQVPAAQWADPKALLEMGGVPTLDSLPGPDDPGTQPPGGPAGEVPPGAPQGSPPPPGAQVEPPPPPMGPPMQAAEYRFPGDAAPPEGSPDGRGDDLSWRTGEKALEAPLSSGEKESVGDWTGLGYAHVNDLLRMGKVFPDEVERAGRIKDDLDALFSRALPVPRDTTVYRIANQRRLPAVGQDLVGKEYHDKGYMSTSLDGHGHSPHAPGIASFHIHVPQGSRGVLPLESVSQVPSEEEVLLQRGSRLHITDAHQDSSGNWHYRAEHIPPSEDLGNSLKGAAEAREWGPGHEYPDMPGVYVSPGAVQARHRLLSEPNEPADHYAALSNSMSQYRNMSLAERGALTKGQKDYYASTSAEHTAARNAGMPIHPALRAEEPSSIPLKTANRQVSAVHTPSVRVLSSMVDRRGIAGQEFPTVKTARVRPYFEEGDSGSGKGTIYAPRTVGTATLYHEYGHWLETHPVVKSHMQNFLKQRTAGEGAQKLSHLTGMREFRDEVAKPDKFIDPYMGKIYSRGDTEVLSTGLEHLADHYKARELAIRDPQMFDVVLTALRGELPGQRGAP